MTAKQLKTDKGFDFSKKYKVSVWVSKHPYAQIPETYFEEQFSKNNTRATNLWSANYQMRFFSPEQMETNGSMDGEVDIEKAAGECSFSESYITNLLSKAKKRGFESVSWIILLFEYEYSAKLSGVAQDDYTCFLGAFNYDDDADSVYDMDDVEEFDIEDEEHQESS